VNGSGTIRVVKRDGVFEPFDRGKLAAAMCMAMDDCPYRRVDSEELACAIEIYLQRKGWVSVSSAAVFEMVLKTFRRVRMDIPAAILETHHTWRARMRTGIRVLYDDGRKAMWDKGWLVKLICSSWRLGRTTARILAGQMENQLLEARVHIVRRTELIRRINALVAAYGLADAVPLGQHALET